MRYLIFIALLSANAAAAEGLRIAWTNNMLRISSPEIAGEYIDTWYLEAFCRSGSTHQSWDKTTIPHKTELLSSSPDGRQIKLRTTVQTNVVLEHEIRAGKDEVEFLLSVTNRSDSYQDVQWFQPCMRVDRFTGRKQTNYIEKCFIFTAEGLKRLNELPRTEEAIYRGGQVYVPAGVPLNDVNPRPISSVKPSNALIGCFSDDEKELLATAWDSTQELFQGVIVCIHNDPRIGGVKPGERKTLRGKVYLLENNPEELLRRYRTDFGRK